MTRWPEGLNGLQTVCGRWREASHAHGPHVLLTLLVGGAWLACTGCVVPWPHMRTTWGPIRGRVEAVGTRATVRGATVEALYADEGRLTATTGEDGCFALPTKERFCWGILFGVALNHSLPHDNCDLPPRVEIRVTAAGYRPLRLALSVLPQEEAVAQEAAACRLRRAGAHASQNELEVSAPPPGWPTEPTGPNGAWELPAIPLVPEADADVGRGVGGLSSWTRAAGHRVGIWDRMRRAFMVRFRVAIMRVWGSQEGRWASRCMARPRYRSLSWAGVGLRAPTDSCSDATG